ncbi:MAG TPA: hypothetical protein IGS37_14150 [Synechococcales cyanobacterium M55_K2018_004]|nr:hypothetical protein [Synechococcales cyanobacterium M55_K2018_004]
MPPQKLSINALPEYEMKLLNSMAFFLGRSIESQATAALAMYLRQNCDRLLMQCEFYARKLGMDKYELLDLISEDSDRAAELLASAGKVHYAEDGPDVFAAAATDNSANPR